MMNPTQRSLRLAFMALGGALLGTLAGCIVYTSEPAYAPAYEGAPPPGPGDETAPPPEDAVVVQADSDFYAPLSAYGQWEGIGSYGSCWVPGDVPPGWRPYSDGNWVCTDAGWYWTTTEPWGWATYHYGRWDFDVRVGWFWVPDTRWAPAWVSWREGHDCIGWAPLRPRERADRDDDDRRRDDFEMRGYVFVEQGRFLNPVRPTTVIRSSTTLISQTTNITNIQVVNQTTINEGPSRAFVERASGRQIQPQDVRTVRREHERPGFTAPQRGRTTETRHAPPPRQPYVPEVKQHVPEAQPAPEARPVYHPAPGNPPAPGPSPSSRLPEAERHREAPPPPPYVPPAQQHVPEAQPAPEARPVYQPAPGPSPPPRPPEAERHREAPPPVERRVPPPAASPRPSGETPAAQPVPEAHPANRPPPPHSPPPSPPPAAHPPGWAPPHEAPPPHAEDRATPARPAPSLPPAPAPVVKKPVAPPAHPLPPKEHKEAGHDNQDQTPATDDHNRKMEAQP